MGYCPYPLHRDRQGLLVPLVAPRTMTFVVVVAGLANHMGWKAHPSTLHTMPKNLAIHQQQLHMNMIGYAEEEQAAAVPTFQNWT
jgi:hypothetical protein